METALERLIHHIATTPHQFAIRIIEPGLSTRELRYKDIHQLMASVAQGLQNASLGTGKPALLVLPTSCQLLGCYLGCMISGIHPIIVAPPQDSHSPSRFAIHLREIVDRLDAAVVLCKADLGHGIKEHLGTPVLDAAAICDEPADDGILADILSSDIHERRIAHLQATSGSTGTPKAAVVTHSNIASNVDAIGRVIGVRSNDLLVSWLPWSHDMGLIGLSYAFYWGIPAVFSDVSNFIRNPLVWLSWISDYQGTISPAPNHAFHICARLAALKPPKHLRLDHWRTALCGAEPVSDKTLAAFQAAFGRFGLQDTTLRPVYGLAEATLAVSIPSSDQRYRIDHIATHSLLNEKRAEPVERQQSNMSFIGLGSAIPGHELRIASEHGDPLPERQIGEIEVRGPSIIPGYWNSSKETNSLLRDDGFLRTGDLGYVSDGHLYVTGRNKDLLKLGGRNFSALQIENFVGRLLPDIVPTTCVAVGMYDEGLQTEALHLLLDMRVVPDDRMRRHVERDLRSSLTAGLGITGSYLHWIRAGQLPKTPSGKVQRFLCRQMLEDKLSERTQTRTS
ncbi:MAG: AMP-binding protein [Geminicoccaceae bacterium]